MTFDQYGLYGHPDHIAISQFTTAAILAATDVHYLSPLTGSVHRVDKLYYIVMTSGEAKAYQAAFGNLAMHINGTERRPVCWKDWTITTRVDTSDYWPVVWDAISHHCSQLPQYQALKDLPIKHHRNLWGAQAFHRALSLVNGGREPETDLFEGIYVEVLQEKTSLRKTSEVPVSV